MHEDRKIRFALAVQNLGFCCFRAGFSEEPDQCIRTA